MVELNTTPSSGDLTLLQDRLPRYTRPTVLAFARLSVYIIWQLT